MKLKSISVGCSACGYRIRRCGAHFGDTGGDYLQCAACVDAGATNPDACRCWPLVGGTCAVTGGDHSLSRVDQCDDCELSTGQGYGRG